MRFIPKSEEKGVHLRMDPFQSLSSWLMPLESGPLKQGLVRALLPRRFGVGSDPCHAEHKDS